MATPTPDLELYYDRDGVLQIYFDRTPDKQLVSMTEIWQPAKLRPPARYDTQMLWLFEHWGLLNGVIPHLEDNQPEVWVWSAPK